MLLHQLAAMKAVMQEQMHMGATPMKCSPLIRMYPWP